MSSEKIYLVKIYGDTRPNNNRLVRAGSYAKALRHITNEIIDVRVASQDDLIDMLTRGVTVEETNADEEDESGKPFQTKDNPHSDL